MSTKTGGTELSARAAAIAAEGALLARGLQYVNAWRGRTVVIKYGGSILTRVSGTVIEDLVLLQGAGVNPVLVHGGGPEISRMLERLGHTPRFVDGLRVTDDETLEVVEMVLSGRANKTLVGRITRAGGSAVGLSGRDGRLFAAAPLRHPPGLGRVGQITAVHPTVTTMAR